MPSEQVMNDGVDDLLFEDRQLREIVYQVHRLMRTGTIDQSCIDAILQRHLKPDQVSYDIHDAYYYAHVLSQISAGEIVVRRVPLGVTPKPDKMVKQNNKVLSKLPHPFYAEF